MRLALSRAVVPLAMVALGALPWWVWWDRLPERVAIHWGPGGAADADTARALGASFACGAVLVPAVVLAVIELRPRPARAIGAAGVVVAFLGGVFGALSLVTVLANRDERIWTDSSLDPWAIALVVLLGAAFAAVVVARLPLHPRLTDSGHRWVAPADADPSWRGTARAGWALGGAALLLLLTGIALAVASVPVGAGIVVVIALGLGPLAALHVEVGPAGVRVSTAVGWPRQIIPMARIAAAEAITIEPMSWGGWGYRGSLRALGRAAWIVRRGPGLRLRLDDDRTYDVTVDGADQAAAVVGELLARTGRPAPMP